MYKNKVKKRKKKVKLYTPLVKAKVKNEPILRHLMDKRRQYVASLKFIRKTSRISAKGAVIGFEKNKYPDGKSLCGFSGKCTIRLHCYRFVNRPVFKFIIIITIIISTVSLMF